MIRLADILFSLIGLIVLSPFFLFIAIWVKMDDQGPVFFHQKRVGHKGEDFFLHKFRTMRMNAEKLGQLTVGGRDLRITKSGYVLRKFKLDELPQLFNVLKGEMSIVGPRPEVRRYVNHYDEEQLKVLDVKPGITDFASFTYVDENDILAKAEDPEKAYIEEILPKKIELNFVFINDPTFYNYLKVIFLTLAKIVGR